MLNKKPSIKITSEIVVEINEPAPDSLTWAYIEERLKSKMRNFLKEAGAGKLKAKIKELQYFGDFDESLIKDATPTKAGKNKSKTWRIFMLDEVAKKEGVSDAALRDYINRNLDQKEDLVYFGRKTRTDYQIIGSPGRWHAYILSDGPEGWRLSSS